ncbi:DUF5123 domain-containing protein [Flavobacterium cheongpyeongense]|jgi:hypothetical protein|uniref:DUF5123 domain-containing protein n=1 Tax=Flavobacterium cheongpyeongense TaxID=2212651 RepID=A0A2V4C7H7_9FLAO|nr:DUF5123 domain-containing protein [Flavobacterium cheongpyeongense]PXY42154.1 DUF5123 domain-containing protein [Flavobacterium cheongpyeongense]
MKNSKRAIYIVSFFSMILLGGMLNSCQQDEFAYAKVGDLFQPKFVLTAPVVKSNSIAVVWYKVNNAVSYTVELHMDNYYSSLFKSYTITDTQILMNNIPYKTQFYIRVRANSDNPKFNSQWAYTNALTEERPAYASILNKVEKVNITENEVTATWIIDAQNPVDSISVAPAQSKELPAIGRKLTANEISKGEATITGLEKNTLYNLNVFDNNKPGTYDKPYNQVIFRSAGPSAETIIVTNGMDLDALLRANNTDPAIPEGTEYFLEAGSLFKITPFTISKGFKLIGGTQGERPQIEMNGNWNIAEGSYLTALAFENIRFYQTIDASYFMNSGNSWTLGEISFYNCVFNHFKRGFWRHQGNGKYKEIGSLDMSYCTFDEVGGHTGPYGTFAFGSAGADNVKSAVFSNCTFMRDYYQTTDKNRNFKNLFDYGSSAYPIHLEYQNITIYDYAYNRSLINLPSAVGSTLIFKNVLLASACGKVIQSIAANSTTEFSNNYTTTDYLLGASAIKGTELGISAQNLFVNPTAGDLTIKDANSPIVTNKVGDVRWLP